MSALYSVVYAIKLGIGRAGRDFAIPVLEGFWAKEPDGIRIWKLGIRAPSTLTSLDVAQAIATLAAKGKDPLVKDVLLENLDEHQLERFSLGLGEAVASFP